MFYKNYFHQHNFYFYVKNQVGQKGRSPEVVWVHISSTLSVLRPIYFAPLLRPLYLDLLQIGIYYWSRSTDRSKVLPTRSELGRSKLGETRSKYRKGRTDVYPVVRPKRSKYRKCPRRRIAINIVDIITLYLTLDSFVEQNCCSNIRVVQDPNFFPDPKISNFSGPGQP